MLKPLVYSNWSYRPETPNLGRNRWFFVPCDLELWQIALKNNRAALLSNIKLCASFHRHTWIKTVVTIRKRLNRILASATLTFDLWPRFFAWTSLLSLVITLENFMISQWWEHNVKCEWRKDIRTYGRTDRWTDWTILLSIIHRCWCDYENVSIWHRNATHVKARHGNTKCNSTLAFIRNWWFVA